jgi:hypothetical protein
MAGGALGLIVGTNLAQRHPQLQITVKVFGTPRAGNGKWADYVEASVRYTESGFLWHEQLMSAGQLPRHDDQLRRQCTARPAARVDVLSSSRGSVHLAGRHAVHALRRSREQSPSCGVAP